MRQPGVFTTSDFNGQYSDVVETCNTWTLYDWLAFSDVNFFFVCKDLQFSGDIPSNKLFPPPPLGVQKSRSFTEIVHNLHRAIAFFVRVQASYEEYDVDKHHYHILEYARSMEKSFLVNNLMT